MSYKEANRDVLIISLPTNIYAAKKWCKRTNYKNRSLPFGLCVWEGVLGA